MSTYPSRLSEIMPALRDAQERHGGWLPLEALREAADEVGVTPAYAKAIASFYDMYHLAPVGTHVVEVCTNLACALAGAQRVVDAFAEELGVAPGETTDDGNVTFRCIECAGGCGYAPVVVIDNRYRHNVQPDDVAGIVGELNAEA